MRLVRESFGITIAMTLDRLIRNEILGEQSSEGST
jgi:hypothetical protein